MDFFFSEGTNKMIVQTLQRSHASQTSFAPRTSGAFVEPAAFTFEPSGGRERYTVHCHIDPQNTRRQDEYQRLRAQVFVHQLGWRIPVDGEGRERDHYDLQRHGAVSAHCVYGMDASSREHLLAGVRVFQLRDWSDSMVMNEFRAVGMIPEHILTLLRRRYVCHDLLELTRFCVQRGRWYAPSSFSGWFNNQVARDLTYAAVFAQARYTGRRNALALVDSRYLQVMKRSHFIFQEVYSRRDAAHSYSLTIIDLWSTIRSIRLSGDQQRANRMLALCAYV